MNIYRIIFFFFVLFVFPCASLYAQYDEKAAREDSLGYTILIEDKRVQLEVIQAINDLYNFKFKEAEKQFGWIREYHPDHPLADFLMGLSQWWKIVPNIDNEEHDERMLYYLNETIKKSEGLLKKNKNNLEAHFFMAGAWGFKGRLYSERKEWRKATVAGRNALDNLQKCEGYENLSPEFVFGRGLYNYFHSWIRENFKFLRPVLAFFPDGDRALGIKQLEEVSRNAFYTRTEAQYYLLQIYNVYEEEPEKGLYIAEYLHNEYPDNAYFERSYARACYMQGKLNKARTLSDSILAKIDRGMPGYEAKSGRYAAFYKGYTGMIIQRDTAEAIEYFKKTVQYSHQTEAIESGYYRLSMAYLARIANKQGRKEEAIEWYKKLEEAADRKSDLYNEADDFLDKNGHKDKFLGIF